MLPLTADSFYSPCASRTRLPVRCPLAAFPNHYYNIVEIFNKVETRHHGNGQLQDRRLGGAQRHPALGAPRSLQRWVSLRSTQPTDRVLQSLWDSSESDPDRLEFLTYARGSCGELRIQLCIGIQAGFIDRDPGTQWLRETREISAMLCGLSNALRSGPP